MAPVTITRTHWIDDDGTGTTGTIINDAAKQEIYGQIDAALAQVPGNYQEGTWTPSVGGSATYSVQDGRYTRVGRAVHIQGHLTITTIGTGSGATISGLPFPPVVQQAGSVGYISNAATGIVFLSFLIVPNSTMQAYVLLSAGASMGVVGIFGNGTDIYFSGTYFV